MSLNAGRTTGMAALTLRRKLPTHLSVYADYRHRGGARILLERSSLLARA